MTTVGLGEGYPSTHLGRFIGVCACLIGMLLVSSMVVSMTMSSEFTQEESKVLIFSWDIMFFKSSRHISFLEQYMPPTTLKTKLQMS